MGADEEDGHQKRPLLYQQDSGLMAENLAAHEEYITEKEYTVEKPFVQGVAAVCFPILSRREYRPHDNRDT